MKQTLKFQAGVKSAIFVVYATSVTRTTKQLQRKTAFLSWERDTIAFWILDKFINCIWMLAIFIEPRHEKTNKMSVCPAKTQISLDIRPVWSESSLCAQWVGKDPSFLHADSEDSDQTERMPRLIWVFAGRTLILLVLPFLWLNIIVFHKDADYTRFL